QYTPPHRLRRLAAECLRPHRAALALALAGMLLQSALLLPVPLLQGWVLDRLTAGDAADLTPAIAIAFATSAGCYVARAIVGWAVASAMHRVSLEVVRDLTDRLHRKLQRQPPAYFDRHPTGDLLARLTGDVGSLLVFLNGGAVQLACDLVLAAGAAGVLVWVQWRLALAAAVVVPLLAVGHARFATVARRLARAAAERAADLYGFLSERLSAVRVVRAFAREPADLAELDGRLDGHRAAALAVVRAGGWQSACAALAGGVGTVLVVTYGAALVHAGRLTVGDMLAFVALLAQLYQPAVRLAGATGLLAGTAAAAERILDVLDAPEPAQGGARLIGRPRGRLEFRAVTFAYRPGGPRVLDGATLTVEPGEAVGVVGPSGAGKSTLLALAGRFCPPSRGSVRLDGRDVRGLDPASLRRAVALVPQQAVLFAGTIRSNLTYAAPDAADADLWRVLEAVDLARLVGRLPRGLATPVGERGFTLSGGQRQRLALGRALLTDPAVLLLDDCTSALDAATAARVHAAVEDLLPGRTRLVVSHAVATLGRCNRIVGLAGGRVVPAESSSVPVLR
ncbi:MAG TPA: ABC transporter ATP-binding protein, partial [Gemmataceae bacterium]